jgi:hypothetical protein
MTLADSSRQTASIARWVTSVADGMELQRPS